MNDRFVKLAYQAKLFDGTGTVPFEDVAKFAELIVRECAKLFVDQKYMILNPHEPFANEETSLPYNSYSEKIKKHFGVEE